jgi:hypothetical protein
MQIYLPFPVLYVSILLMFFDHFEIDTLDFSANIGRYERIC